MINTKLGGEKTGKPTRLFCVTYLKKRFFLLVPYQPGFGQA